MQNNHYYHTESVSGEQGSNANYQNGTYFTPQYEAASNYTVPPLRERKSVKLGKKDFIFTALFAVISFLTVDFTMLHGLNFGFTLSFFVLFIAVSAYLFSRSNKASAFTYICGALSLAGSVTFTVYHDSFINTVMFVIVSGLFTAYALGLSGTFANKQGSYKMIFDMLSGVFVNPFSSIAEIKNGYTDSNKNTGFIKNVLIGAGISFPVLLVVIPLLVSSDEAFGSLISLVLKNVGLYLVELAAASLLFLYLILYLVSKRKKLSLTQAKSKETYKGFVPETVSVSFLGVISAVYITYLFSQLAYFFSAFSGILPDGYKLTASEFARRGFFEMFAICVINMIIITFVTVFTRRTGRRSVAVKLVSAFIMLFSVLLLVTSMAKMALNIEIFGLSKNRVLVCVFMLMLLVAIFFYILHIINPKIPYMQSVIVLCSVIFIALAFCNIDARICAYNINAYENHKIDTLDTDYLGELNDAKIPYLVKLAENKDENISLAAKYYLYDYRHYTYSDYESNDFRAYNYTVREAKRLYSEYYNSMSDSDKKYFDEELSADYEEKLYSNDDYEYAYDGNADDDSPNAV